MVYSLLLGKALDHSDYHFQYLLQLLNTLFEMGVSSNPGMAIIIVDSCYLCMDWCMDWFSFSLIMII